MNASGCGVTVKDYGHLLARDADHAAKAERISELTRDLSELLPDIAPRLKPRLRLHRTATRLAFHPPCTLQAWPAAARRRRDASARSRLRRAPRADRKPPLLRLGRHLLGATARARLPLARPQARNTSRRSRPQAIVSANIGCIQHLQSGTTTPVAALGRGAGRSLGIGRPPVRGPRQRVLDAILRQAQDERGAEGAVLRRVRSSRPVRGPRQRLLDAILRQARDERGEKVPSFDEFGRAGSCMDRVGVCSMRSFDKLGTSGRGRCRPLPSSGRAVDECRRSTSAEWATEPGMSGADVRPLPFFPLRSG